jgi:hypothetical protein
VSLRLLLDEQMSRAVVEQVRGHRPDIVIDSVRAWRQGAFCGHSDRELLVAASAEGWTLVTYDLRTIPDMLFEYWAEGLSHSGVLFIDEQAIPSNAFGILTRALIYFWDRHQALDWRDRIHFLDRPPL